jgi:signal transduction histidine kinase
MTTGERAADGRPGRDPPDRERLRQLADEQAALRRVATLVARGVPPAEVFAAVANEVGRLLDADTTTVVRLDPMGTGRPGMPGAPEGPEGAEEAGAVGGTVVIVAREGRISGATPVGSRWKLEPGMAMTAALRTGAPVRRGVGHLTPGPFASWARKTGVRMSVATPIVVAGGLWGLIVASTVREAFPAGTESRLADFTELVATAIANAQAREELRQLADAQAALRRVATLVARGVAPAELFAAVTKETLGYFGDGTARMIRFEPGGTATLVANEGTTGPHVRVGGRWDYPPDGLTAIVRRTGGAARVDDFRQIPGGEPFFREGIRSAVATPILVDGRLWGLIAVGSGEGPLPAGTEQRMAEFTELVATAIANAQSQAELTTSRARIVTASDEARRRIERDLHDGAQQRLVSLSLRLRSASSGTTPCREEIRAEITDVASGLAGVLDELREISRGIHPAVLSEAGLGPALRALAGRSAVPVRLDVRIGGRLPEPVEVAAYYVVSEMLTNAAKHARASVAQVDAEASGGTLRVSVRDDGTGGADPARGSGLVGLKDRVEALGGTFSVNSPDGGGTTVCCALPLTGG